MKYMLFPLAIAFASMGANTSHALSNPETVPYSKTWKSNRYSHSTPWFSTRATVGAALMKLDPAVAFSESAIGEHYGLGLTIHANHFLGLSLDMDTHSKELGAEEVEQGWDYYKVRNRIFTLSGRISPLHTEIFDIGIKIGVSINTLDSEARKMVSQQKWTWTGTEFAASMATEFLAFPIHNFEIGASIRTHYLMGSSNEDYFQTGEIPNAKRVALGIGLQAGWHF